MVEITSLVRIVIYCRLKADKKKDHVNGGRGGGEGGGFG